MRLLGSFFLILLSFCSEAQEYQLARPILKVANNGFFQDQAVVEMDFRLEGATLRYTLDGSEPKRNSKRYKKVLTFSEGRTIKVKAFKKGFEPSETVSYELLKVEPRIQKIEISPMPHERYPGNGGQTLADLKAGSFNIRDGNWLGYNNGPITITIDLGESNESQEVILSTLSSPASWIMPPASYETLVSTNGSTFINLSNHNIFPLTKMEGQKKAYYSFSIGNLETRYVKLIINPLSELPDWHPGKGNPAWLFIDEIIIK